MPEFEDLNLPEHELAEALRGIELAPLRTSQSAIWYQAGLHAGRRRAHVWRFLAAMTTLVAAMLLVWDRHAPGPVQRIVYVDHKTAPAAAVAWPTNEIYKWASAAEYLRLCNEVIEEGVDRPSQEHPGSISNISAPPVRQPGWDGDSDLLDSEITPNAGGRL